MTYSEFFEAFHGGAYSQTTVIYKRVLGSMTAPERTAWKLLEDITDRRGWRQAWEGFDEAIKDEIFAAFIVIISKETTIVAIDRKALAEKLVQILREEGLDSPYIDAADLSDVTLDGWWNLERVAEKLAEYIESQRET